MKGAPSEGALQITTTEQVTAELSGQQRVALDAICEWWNDGAPQKQVFRLNGFAGTGKTTIAKLIPGELSVDRSELVYIAFTGKAVSVLQGKRCWPAQTLHSLIYRPKEKARDELHALRRTLARATEPAEVVRLTALIEEVEEELEKPVFARKPQGELSHLRLIVVDEVSMLGDDLGHDLADFGIPIIAIGDPAQLPPVDSAGGRDDPLREGYFMREPADVTLTEVHRQQADSPILEMATRVRDGRGLQATDYCSHTVQVVGAAQPNAVILVGTNKTRWHVNTLVRRSLKRQAGRPQPGDRIVCLHNNTDLMIFNGQLFDVLDVGDSGNPDAIVLTLREEGAKANTKPRTIRATLDGFIDEQGEKEGKRRANWRRDLGLFTWGYALTVHKSQGSQWDYVFLVDESRVFRRPGEAQRWQYTGITRASQQVMLGGASQLVAS